MKILVIDSNKTICGMLSDYFTKEGHDCLCAVDGRNGLSLILKEKYDAVLLCLKMPEFSGYDLIDALEEKGKLRESNIIVFTSVHLSESEIKELERRGVCSYLRQPAKLDVILKAIETFCKMKSL